MITKNILQEGIDLYNRRNYSASLAFFLGLSADSDADPVDVSYYLGLCYSKLKRYDDALLYLENVVTSSESDDSINSESEHELDRVLQCRYLLAVIYCITGRKKLADYELNKLLDTGYKPASVYASLAYIAWQQDDVKQCLDYYEQSLALEQNNQTALNGLGYVLACENKDLPKALSFCKKAYEISPNSAAVLDSLGWVYYKLGIMKEARQYLEMAKKIDGDNVEIKAHLAALEQNS